MKYFLLIGPLCYGVPTEATAQTSAPADSSQFRCTIRPSKRLYASGEEVQFLVEVHNRAATPQTLVKPVAGSESGFIFPTARFEVYRVRGLLPKKKVVPQPGAFTRSLAPDDFVPVGPGQSLNLFAEPERPGAKVLFSEVGFDNLPAGKYEVRFAYSLVPTEPQRGRLAAASSNQKSVADLLTQVPAVELRSNAVQLTVEK
jgi:hypothetical protein